MITHEEAKENTLYLHGKYDNAYKTLNDYITQQEQFAKDVARYFELKNLATMKFEDLKELDYLEEKLTKGVAK